MSEPFDNVAYIQTVLSNSGRPVGVRVAPEKRTDAREAIVKAIGQRGRELDILQTALQSLDSLEESR